MFGIKHGSKNLIRFVAKPTVTGAYTFDNTAKSASISGYDAKAMTISGTQTATNAGTYTVRFTLNRGYMWTDRTSNVVSLTWSIAKRSITIPAMTNTSYTWEVDKTFKPTITGLNTTYVTQTGTASSTSAGSWTVTWALKDSTNSQWSDKTTANKTGTWSVAKRSITIPSIANGSFTYAINKTFKPTITGVDTNYVTQSGTVSSTSAGSWTVTWALKDSTNSQWSDKTTANKTGTWSVAKLSLTIPSISSAKSFSFIEGTTRSVTVANYNGTYETQSGTTSTSALGSHTITWTLKDTANTQWSDKTVANKTASWSIVWTNGTSHYSNDIYNRGWGSSNLEFRNGEPIWNADSFELDTQHGTFVRATTSFGSGAVFHAMVKWTSGTHGVSVYRVKSDWGTTTASTTSVGESFTEVSGTNSGNVSLFNKMGIRNNNSSSYQLVVQRIWKT